MTRYVIDASVAVEYLLKTPIGLALADLVERAPLFAPELIDAEVLSVLRGAVLGGRIEEGRAVAALDDLSVWPLDRIPNRTLARLAWWHLHNVSAYDAFYVAAARVHDATLLTADGSWGVGYWVSWYSRLHGVSRGDRDYTRNLIEPNWVYPNGGPRRDPPVFFIPQDKDERKRPFCPKIAACERSAPAGICRRC